MTLASGIRRVAALLALLSCSLFAACGGGGSTTIILGVPGLLVVITTDPTSVFETGETVEYTIVVLNNGGDSFTIDAFFDDTYDLATQCSDAVGTVLAVTETYTCVFSEFVSGDFADSPFVNTTSVTVTSAGGSTSVLATGSVALLDELMPDFVAGDPFPGTNEISMQPGAVSGTQFDVDIMVSDIDDFFGAAFHVTFDSATVNFLGFDTTGSILSGMNPSFFAELLSGSTDEIAVEASLQGSGAGLPNGDGLLITLRFEVTGARTNNAFEFLPMSFRKVTVCPTAGLPCPENTTVVWFGGVLNSS